MHRDLKCIIIFLLFSLTAQPAHSETQVFLLPKVLLPDVNWTNSSDEKIANRGDLIYKADVVSKIFIEVSKPIEFSMAGFKYTAAAGDRLVGAVVVKDKPADLPDDAIVYCDKEIGTESREIVGTLTLGLSNLVSKYKKPVRICLFDKNDDGVIDHAFIAGAKNAKDQVLYSFPDLPYQIHRNEPIGAPEQLRVELSMPDSTAPLFSSGPRYHYYFTLDGKIQYFKSQEQTYRLILFHSDGLIIPFDSHVAKIDVKNLPSVSDLFGLKIATFSYDSTSKSVKYSLKSNMQSFEFILVPFVTSTIVIYY